MMSADGPDGGKSPDPTRGLVDVQLVESLMHVLIEKGILTRNDVLSVVQVVAEVQRGILEEGLVPKARTETALIVLQRLYDSFEALADRSKPVEVDGDKVRYLRPPLHGDQPGFPKDDN
jgi:hypothetical protein